MKTKGTSTFWICVGMSLMLAFSLTSYLFNTSVGKSIVREIDYPTAYGTLTGVMYRPQAATATATVPAIIIAHEYGGTRESMDLPAIELSKRGYAVFDIDLYGHGRSTLYNKLPDNAEGLLDYGAAGIWDALNYLRNCTWVNMAKVAVLAQSVEEVNSLSKALELDNANWEKTGTRLISAVYFVGCEPADYDAIRTRDAGILVNTKGKNLFDGGEDKAAKDFATTANAHKFVNQYLADTAKVGSDPVVNGLEKLKTPGYNSAAKANVKTITQTISTAGKAAGEVVTFSEATFLQVADEVKSSGGIITWSFNRVAANGTKTAITNTTSKYTLVAADVAAGVSVEITATFAVPAVYRAIYIANVSHSMVNFSFAGARSYINFFGLATQVRTSAYLGTNATSEHGQSWWLKEFSGIMAMIGFFCFVAGVAIALSGFKFKSKEQEAVLAAEGAEGAVVCDCDNTACETAHTGGGAETAAKEEEHKRPGLFGGLVYWISFAVMFLAGGLFFWAVAAGDKVTLNFNAMFNQPQTTSAMVYGIIMAVVMIAVFAVSMIINRRAATQEGGLKAWFTKWGILDWPWNIVKALVAAILTVIVAFACVFFISWLWQTDFGIFNFTIRAFTRGTIGTVLKYVLFFLIYFAAQSFVVNNGLAVWKSEALNCLLSAVAIAGGVLFIGIVANVPCGYLVPVLAASACLSRATFKGTGKIWTGAFVNALLMTAILCASTVTLL